jgi:D-aminopeptidase
MGGTEKAITPHSRWDINNGEMYLSEASMAAAIAGDFGVPTVFVSGDNNIVEEVREKIPSISSAVVKTALGTYQAKSVIPARACEMIKNGVTEGLKNSRNIAPFKISGPITLQLLDSEDHTLPLGPILEKAVTAETVSEAFMGCVEAMPWNSFNTVNPDGFQYP